MKNILLKFIFVFILILFIIPCVGQDKIYKEGSDTIYTVCDTMPEFPGDYDSLHQFISKNLKYPIICGDNAPGRVTIRFVVTREGKVKDLVIIRGIDSLKNQEALRIISVMPDWIPAKHNGENVSVYYHIPIVFRLWD